MEETYLVWDIIEWREHIWFGMKRDEKLFESLVTVFPNQSLCLAKEADRQSDRIKVGWKKGRN